MGTRWPIEDRELYELELDLRNVRIPAETINESAIANYLVEAEDLLDLVRDILRDGYLDNDLPVVVLENGRHVVVEGNRRITALKAIQNPGLLGKSAPRVERLLSRYPDADKPTQVRVMVAPSREAAQPLLARLHTRNAKKAWLREQQAVFYHSQLSSSVSVDDLRTIYPIGTTPIASFIRMGEMRELIRGMKFDDPGLEDFVKTSQLKMASFEYAYELPKIRQALGLNFNKDGLLADKELSEGQRRGLMYLLGEFRAKRLNTRSPELKSSKPEHDILVERLHQLVGVLETGTSNATGVEESAQARQHGPTDGFQPGSDAPNGSERNIGGSPKPGTGSTGGEHSGGTGSGTGPGGPANQTGSTERQPSPRGPNRGETRSRLDMEGFEYKGSSPGLRRRFEELRRLDVRDFPNAAHDLLRTVLECSIKDHFVTVRHVRLTGRTLGFCMTELASAYQTDQRMTSLINAVNRKGKMPAAQYSGTTLSLNASNHEPDSFVASVDAHEAWDRIKPILIEIVGS
ncbi:hypothetical protein GA0070622_2128 [Micromonospora sediminicola]|uniref:ParB-like nuclease domain-containing protein n=1 Tax=Micromonospora sediminicola TaxID=946078 RepID=A0A1A9B7R5_9ACTN|nr:hypothetical protein [Micromonospora sediminicola]SBT65136.1 hypothetical protein GA0070622_2128 [Micromonospora sediminicola]